MELHSDFDKQAIVHAAEQPWVPSPAAGVNRRMLDRVGDEVARATTIVRFDAGSAFDPHTHGGGEEFLVLEGVFQDEHGDYPAGTYIRNPPTSRHTPRSDEGCTILVKLWQFDPDDRTFVVQDMAKTEVFQDSSRPGVWVRPLFQDSRETVRVETWSSDEVISLGHSEGAEYFVLSGGFTFEDEVFKVHSWLRLPAGQKINVIAQQDGATVWCKTGHLAGVSGPVQP